MGMKIAATEFNKIFKHLHEEYKIYAPKLFKGEGAISGTDVIRYSEVNWIEEIVFDTRSDYSAKEVFMPMTQTLFFHSDGDHKTPKNDEKKILVFLKSCDIHALRVLDDTFKNGRYRDIYYTNVRDRIKIVLMGCKESHESCFCVSMGTNKTDQYDMYIDFSNGKALVEIQNDEFSKYFENIKKEDLDVEPNFVTENSEKVKIPKNLSSKVNKSKVWDEFDKRCIDCGRCNFVCPTCTCFAMQDVRNEDNHRTGERRRVWASCHVDGYTDMAGGHSFRKKSGARMRFKTMHKVHDYKERHGYHMCTGCGRCTSICPEYISFSAIINKLKDAMKEVS